MNAPRPPSPHIDTDRIDDAVLALLWLGIHDKSGATWKGFDWTALERLHDKGFISNPVGKAKSVYLRRKAWRAAKRSLRPCLWYKTRLRRPQINAARCKSADYLSDVNAVLQEPLRDLSRVVGRRLSLLECSLPSETYRGARFSPTCYEEGMTGREKVVWQVKGVTCGHAKRLQRKAFSRPTQRAAGHARPVSQVARISPSASAAR